MIDMRETLRRGIGEFSPQPGAYRRVLERHARRARNRRVGAFAVTAIIAGAGVFAIVQQSRSGLSLHDSPSSPGSVVTSSAPSMATPTPHDEGVVHGWPGARHNPRGVYSWDAQSNNWMHNPTGASAVEISFNLKGPGPTVPLSEAVVTVAGSAAMYRELPAVGSAGDIREEWIVDINGTTVSIRLRAHAGTTETELAEAHAVVDSIRSEPQKDDPGFVLIFTLPNGWDSG
jgi:hypothetical protein